MTQGLALITGASAGIGAATAKILAKNKFDLILLARRKERLERLQDELTQQSKVKVYTVPVDINNRKSVEAHLQALPLAQVNVLINNAGLAKGTAKLFEVALEDLDQMIDTNVKSLVHLTKLLVPHMIKQNAGHVVNIGSVAGRWTYSGGGVYSGTKFAVRALSEALRMDLLGTPIRVTNIEPGMVETEFSQVRFSDQEKAKAVYQGMKPLLAEDIAEAIWWSLSRPAHVNIQEMVVFPTDQGAIQSIHRRI